MIILDRLLVGSIRFVLDKIVAAVDGEMNNEERIREELLAAQMRLELGEIDDETFAETERQLLARLREIQERKRGGRTAPKPGEFTIEGVETTFDEPAPQHPPSTEPAVHLHEHKAPKRSRRKTR